MALTGKYSFYNYISLISHSCIYFVAHFIKLFHKLLLITGCNAKHLFHLIQGSWGEQPDVESPPQDEDEPVFKRFRASSPTPLTTSISLTISSSTPRQPPTKYFIPPGRLAHWPTFQPDNDQTMSYMMVTLKSITVQPVAMQLATTIVCLLMCDDFI